MGNRDKAVEAYEVSCLGFREHHKNTMVGFAKLRVDPPGLVFEVVLHQKENKSWVGLPSKPWQDKNGVTQYQKVLDLPDSSDFWRFNSLSVSAIAGHIRNSTTENDIVPF